MNSTLNVVPPEIRLTVMLEGMAKALNASHQRQSARVAGTLSDCMRLLGAFWFKC